MTCLNFGSRQRAAFFTASAFAALPVFAFMQLALAAPASAHGYHHYRHESREHVARVTAQDSAQNYQSSYQQSSPADGMAASAASAAGIPVSLVERVIKRESGGNPRAVSKGNYGLMQIRLGTARAMGYSGSAEGLLDAQTNMTYAVKYLAGAYRAAGGNESRAVALYASGYYAQAKAKGFSPYETAQSSGSFGGYQQVAEATPQPYREARFVRSKNQDRYQDGFDQAQYGQPRYQQARYEQVRYRRSRSMAEGYGDGQYLSGAPQFNAAWGQSGWHPGLYAYAPAYQSHYRVRHYRHHAV